MADVIGPCSTLPGASFTAPANQMCDDHPDRPAYRRVQGETDSFGAEMHDMCQECFEKHRRAVAESDKSGFCEWGKHLADVVSQRRDLEEGSSGPLYSVCSKCYNAHVTAFIGDDDDEF